MAGRYLETARQLKGEVDTFMERFVGDLDVGDLEGFKRQASVALGHIINLAVRCNPRQSQGTVRKNIVATAMEDHCKVTMTRERDERTGKEFNKIHISAK